MRDPASSPSDSCLLDRVREAVRGHAIIDWSPDRFEPFLALFNVTRLERGNPSQFRDGSIYLNSLPLMIRMHLAFPTSHVLITGLNINWGAFSTTVPNRTIDWGQWDSHLATERCSRERVLRYLDDPRVKGVVATQHTILTHSKILSLPVGVLNAQALRARIDGAHPTRSEDLLINNSGWGHRAEVNAAVSSNFGGRCANTFGVSEADYLEAILRSRFVLCPSGLGWDSFRVWETLLLGSIPVVEQSPGWDTLLADLPVLLVPHFDQVTPELLARAYPEILSRCDTFIFGKLTTAWWTERITRVLGDSAWGQA
jgi:hypothetical protein